jgi:hypothetical protein
MRSTATCDKRPHKQYYNCPRDATTDKIRHFKIANNKIKLTSLEEVINSTRFQPAASPVLQRLKKKSRPLSLKEHVLICSAIPVPSSSQYEGDSSSQLVAFRITKTCKHNFRELRIISVSPTEKKNLLVYILSHFSITLMFYCIMISTIFSKFSLV